MALTLFTSCGAHRQQATDGQLRYASTHDEVMRLGRQLDARLHAGDADALFAAFAPAFAAVLSRQALGTLLADLAQAGSAGAVVDEGAQVASPAARTYTVERPYAGALLRSVFAFDAANQLSGLKLDVRAALPADPAAGRVIHSKPRLPVAGTWWVFWGGASERENYHVVTPGQRHAYDLAVWQDGATYRGTGERNEDYFAWSRPVLAPAAGVVIAARGDLADNRPRVEMHPETPAGNHVVLDLGHGEYAFLAHLKQGSLRVKVGQRVRRGQELGLCGNSGNTSEPHVHIHLQDQPELFAPAGIGLALAFHDYVADGRTVTQGVPVQGQFVRSR